MCISTHFLSRLTISVFTLTLNPCKVCHLVCTLFTLHFVLHPLPVVQTCMKVAHPGRDKPPSCTACKLDDFLQAGGTYPDVLSVSSVCVCAPAYVCACMYCLTHPELVTSLLSTQHHHWSSLHHNDLYRLRPHHICGSLPPSLSLSLSLSPVFLALYLPPSSFLQLILSFF